MQAPEWSKRLADLPSKQDFWKTSHANSTSQNKPQPRCNVSSIGPNALYRRPTIRRRDSMPRPTIRVGWRLHPSLLPPNIEANNYHFNKYPLRTGRSGGEVGQNNKSRWLLIRKLDTDKARKRAGLFWAALASGSRLCLKSVNRSLTCGRVSCNIERAEHVVDGFSNQSWSHEHGLFVSQSR